MINETDVNVAAVADPSQASGVSGGDELAAYVDAVITGTTDDVDMARGRLEAVLGPTAVVDAAAVIAMFTIMNRVADATGTPVDQNETHDVRQAIGAQLGMSDPGAVD